jgi:hypothetical protein
MAAFVFVLHGGWLVCVLMRTRTPTDQEARATAGQ